MDFKALIRTAAPWIGAALPGPLGGIATNAINAALGNSPDTKLGDVEKAFASGTITADQMVALKAQDQKFQETMQQLGFEDIEKLEAIAAADRANARERETKTGDWTPRIIGYLLVGSFVGTAVLVLTGHAKADSVLAGTVIGYISAKCEQVVTYYFGSSAGSDRKTELLAQAPAIEKK